MKILSVDTSARMTSVAIVTEHSVLAEYNIDTREAGLTHSQSLMPMIESVAKVAQTPLTELDGFAVAEGPGSFTGLRIGIGAVKGLAYALSKPCVGVSTLHALALNAAGHDGIICAAMDARCKQVYTAVFESTGGKINRLTEDMAIAIDGLVEKLASYRKSVFFVGDGADLCYNNLAGKSEHDIILAHPSVRYQRAANVGFAAMDAFINGKAVISAELMPVYLRLPQAEREYLAKQKS